MLVGFTALLLFQLAGELLSRLLHLPVPGPVMGMILLFVFLVLRRESPSSLRTASEGLLRHMTLLYVPAGVGLMVHYRLIARDWLSIGAALLVSTLLTLSITAVLLQWLQAKRAGQDQA